MRALGLYDFEIMDNQDAAASRSATKPKNLVGSYTRLLDAFGYARFDLGSMPSELRLGRQVVSWGESTFIQGGLNVINHFDVSALRVPGSELKEAFLPQEMAVFNLQFNDEPQHPARLPARLERHQARAGGLLLQHQRFRGPRAASAWCSASARSPTRAWTFARSAARSSSDFQNVNRAARRASRPNSGQYGINFKFYLPDLNNGTEFGLYFLNYHSRLPRDLRP